MKKPYYLFLILLFPFSLSAQSIHGLWSGTMKNDSTGFTQNFELGLSEYRGKITGFTYQTYIDNDTFYYSIKRIRAERIDGYLVVEDVEMIANNFPERAAKRVKVITKFPLVNDTTIDFLSGHWNTNKTKQYYAIGGKVEVKEQQNEDESDLIAHLTERKVKHDIAVNKPEKKKQDPVVKKQNAKDPPRQEAVLVKKDGAELPQSKTAGPQTEKSSAQPVTEKMITTREPIVVKKDDPKIDIKNVESSIPQKTEEKNPPLQNVKKTETVNTITQNKPEPQPVEKTPVKAEQVVVKNIPEQNKKITAPEIKASEKLTVNQQPVTAVSNSKTIEKKTEQPVLIQNKTAGIKNANPPIPVITTKNETAATKKELPTAVSSRKSENIQNLYFKNDSLTLSLYDNGVVDGDTVSVFLNGNNIISKQKLSTAATKKVIYTSSFTDSLELVLFADNLGSIPPNTGLLTIRDGDEVYQVRFSADLNKNASIILRRKY